MVGGVLVWVCELSGVTGRWGRCVFIDFVVLRRGMAQPGSALDWGSRGHRFKSCCPDHSSLGSLRINLSAMSH